ncbi:MAG: T9SS type A sorting domain-containing protein [Crocinitomicaceae bacterium]
MKTIALIFSLIPFILFSQTYPCIYFSPSEGDIYGEDLIFSWDSSLLVRSHKLNNNGFLIKLDDNGEILQEKKFNGKISNLIKTKDTAYLASIEYGNSNLTIAKFNINLDTIWTKNYVFTNSVRCNNILQSIDSNYLFALTANSEQTLLKTNGNGQLIWSKTYLHGSDPSQNCLITEALDSSLYFAVSGNPSTMLLNKLNYIGNVLWTKWYDDQLCNSILIDSNATIYVGGFHVANNRHTVTRIDSSGLNVYSYSFFGEENQLGAKYKMEWHQDSLFLLSFGYFFNMGYGSNLFAINKNLEINSSWYVYGDYPSFHSISSEIYLISNGPIYGIKTLPSGPHFEIGKLINHASCSNLGGSMRFPELTYQNNVFSSSESNTIISISPSLLTINNPSFVKYNQCLVAYGGINENNLSNLSIYPNPSTGQFTIESDEGKLIENIQIHSPEGRLVYTHENLKKSKALIQLGYLPKGIYYIKAQIGSEFIFEKIIIE